MNRAFVKTERLRLDDCW